ncbi:hypothetical protein J2S00_000983 [Caldalkalibacillus uzonensis]|uniref:UGSC-like domain-containing protein n=1 Tax=Caldalkalibacillus uzonensis TaxID=353224 RepID=A0ABU0CP58_9BACI|nr:hypothetical protein [Caldalkalibacillus uzonensis]MDQ0338199.1 hypothetical protein [Caldalkalibacillus uzonensis]
MLDGIYAEEHKVPAVVICTEAFSIQCQNMARVHGYSHLPLVEINHPLSTAAEETMLQEAMRILPDVLKAIIEKN